jgi:hypothetical protein
MLLPARGAHAPVHVVLSCCTRTRSPKRRPCEWSRARQPASFHETTDTVDLKPFQRWKPKPEKPEQYNVAAYVEGTLKSAFPSGDKMGIETPEKSAKSARVFVLLGESVLANPFARAGEGQDMSKYGMQGPVGGDKELQELAQRTYPRRCLPR